MLEESTVNIVVGLGEVGKAIQEVLEDKFSQVFGIDKDSPTDDLPKADCLHICIPFNDQFVEICNNYREQLGKEGCLMIIHSTVALGTTEQIKDAVHSPVRGVHPNLADGIRTFKKYFGGPRSEEAAKLFLHICDETMYGPDSKTAEAIKLWDTTYYGWNIVFEKMVWEYCQANGLNFDVIYNDANLSYNLGYEELGRLDVQRPVLKHIDGPIGGHCVIPNCKLLGGDIARFILTKNEELYDVQRSNEQNGTLSGLPVPDGS